MSKLPLILIVLLYSCFIQRDGGSSSCTTVNYADSTDDFKIIQRMVFDTTASLVHATLIDAESRSVLTNARMQVVSGGDKFIVRTGKDGIAKVFRNGIEGYAEVTFSAKGYRCLTVSKFLVGGGQILSVRLRKA